MPFMRRPGVPGRALPGARGPGADARGAADADGPPSNALSYPNYRRFWFGAVVRVFGFQFQLIGAGWLVAVELGRSPFWLGVVWLANALPTILLSVPGGSLADRRDPYRLVVASQFLIFAAHGVLAVLILTGAVRLWMVVAWAVANGCVWAVGAPATNALLPRLIGAGAMPSAVALLSGIWSAMRIVGPASAGILIALVGTGQAFSLAAVLTAASIFFLLAIRLPPRASSPGDGDGDPGVMAGLRFVFARPVFLATIGLSFFTSVFGGSYVVLLPLFADDLLEAGATGFGFMEAAAGVGALAGTWAVIRWGIGRRPGLVMLGSAAAFGALVAAFAATDHLAPASALLLAGGFAAEVYLVVGMTVLQLLVPDGLRGRVMGIWSLTYFLSPAGGFLAGVAAEVVGVRVTVAAGALAVAAFALAVLAASGELRRLRREDVRPPPRPAATAPAP